MPTPTRRLALLLLSAPLAIAGCAGEVARHSDLAALPGTPHTAPAAEASAAGLSRPEAVTPTAGEWTYLTGGRTFERLMADQRWPVFSASYRVQESGRHLDHYEHISAGDTIALARGPVRLGDREPIELELGVQAGVFSVFDAGHEQSLIITDYVASAYAAARRGPASGMLRFWHVSGHVGDEFLLDDEYDIDERTPYKFEAVQVLGSYDLPAGFRIYGGPSALFGVNPSDFGSLILHAGAEWHGEARLWDVARPVAGADGQFVEGLDFEPDLSVRAGLSFDRRRRGPAFQVLGEIYTGRDPNGELFSDRVTFFGLGLFLNL